MSAILNVFKVKEFDLEPIFSSWTTAPIFNGKPKRDLPVDEWLKQIRAGCKQRNVPKAYWHKVGYHYMGKDARTRLDELKQVMRNLVGGKYKWDWKAFKVAMRNMGWDIDKRKTQIFDIQSKPSGVWWIVGKGKNKSNEKSDTISEKDSDSMSIMTVDDVDPSRPSLKKFMSSLDISSLKRTFPRPKRSATMSAIETVSSQRSSLSSSSPPSPPPPYRKTSLFPSSALNKPLPSEPPTTVLAATEVAPPVTSTAQAPVWLVNACQALDFLTVEHPKVMTTVAAVLITVGSIPAIPAISAGAGGAFLASGTAHAIGSLAVGLGSLLQAQAKISEVNQGAKPEQPPAGSSSSHSSKK